MDARFLDRYNEELRFIREMGKEFASRYPNIASKLDLGGTECADPYVERLIEGFAFLTARIQLKLDAEFPKFTQHLLEMVYPHYLAPTPSMTIVEFEPDLKGGVTETGFELPRHTELVSIQNLRGHVNCKYLTAHDVTLWPIRITEASYLTRGEAAAYNQGAYRGVKSAIRLRLETVMDIAFQDLEIEQLDFHLHGGIDIATRIYELLFAHNLGVMIQPARKNPAWRKRLHRSCVRQKGFDPDQALLPFTQRSFSGYRLLLEYFTLPERFLFFELVEMQAAIKSCDDRAMEIVILLDRAEDDLEDLLDLGNIALNCTPAVNLFPKRTDRLHIEHKSTSHHAIVDRTRPLDYEIYSVGRVTGYGEGSTYEQRFNPFYGLDDSASPTDKAYYTLERRPTLESISAIGTKPKSQYLGHEMFVSLVDADEAPYRSDLNQLGLQVLCTNRGLPLYLVKQPGVSDFNLEIGAPVDGIQTLTGYTQPRKSYPEGDYVWRLVSHLSLNYLTLLDSDSEEGADALRELLSLYGDFAEPAIAKQIDGLLGVESGQIVRRIPMDGPMAFGRGVEVELLLDDTAFQGAGAFLFGAVLERFFSKYVSINSFTQTRVVTRDRGEIMQWPVRSGTRALT